MLFVTYPPFNKQYRDMLWRGKQTLYWKLVLILETLQYAKLLFTKGKKLTKNTQSDQTLLTIFQKKSLLMRKSS